MNAEVKQAWLAALRSGEYQQGRGRLQGRSEDGRHLYCCLGVLCDLYSKAHPQGQWDEYGEFVIYDGTDEDAIAVEAQSDTLPSAVIEWARVPDTNPDAGEHCLAEYNDGSDTYKIRPHTFAEIADLIEAHL